MSKSNRNIVLTGGHARSTAYATICEIKKRKKDWKLHFIGSKTALEGTNIPTIEMETFPDMGVKFVPIFTGRVQRKFTIWTVPSLIKIPFGFIHAVYILLKLKPRIIISFGGYSAFPVVVIGWVLKIPIIIHEQTASVGRANKYSSFFASKIAISRRSSRPYFPKGKVVLTGNPVSAGALAVKPKEVIGKPPTILITGGQTGSVKINSVIEEILGKLLKEFKLIHQVGSFQYDKFAHLKESLPKRFKKRYEVYSVISPKSWPNYLEKADIIISRAGANIISEILVSKRPSVLIPLPSAYLDEQRKNAEFAQQFGIAEIIEQDHLSPEKLIRKIKSMKTKWNSVTNKVKRKESPDLKAVHVFVDLIEDIKK